jgi:hydrogenase expression/formation protein HypC
MCIGIPMQVVESGFGYARCEGMGMQREVETLLVGEQPPGTWLLIFLDSAREVLSEEDAARITDAVKAVDLIMQNDGAISQSSLENETIEALFADLIDREIPKPDSLIALEQSRKKH